MGTAVRLFVCIVLLGVSGASPAGQTAATSRVMREKLVHSQQVLRAIMISDYALLDREAAALLQLTRAEGWQVLNSPEYIRHSDAFRRSIEELAESAKARDLDGAAVEYSSLVMRCYQCHRYLKGMRIAAGAAPSDALLLARP
jgi:hypothetical protein